MNTKTIKNRFNIKKTNHIKTVKNIKTVRDILKKPTMKINEYYTGNFIEILVNIFYLLKTYPKKVCIIKPNNIFNIQNSIAILWKKQNNKYVIKYPGGKDYFFNQLKKCRKRFIIVPLFIFLENNQKSGHANILIFDLKSMTIERFEPYGSLKDIYTIEEEKRSSKFDTEFKKDVRNKTINSKKFKYIPSNKFCPIINVQSREENNLNRGFKTGELKEDPDGYCGLWIIWYANLKLKYPDLDSTKLLKKSMELLESNKHSLRSFIRKYGNFLKNNKISSLEYQDLLTKIYN